MKPTLIFKVLVGVLVVAALAWLIVHTIRASRPYRVDAAALSGWTLVLGDPGGPVLVALQPPAQLSAALFQQVLERAGQSLVAPDRPWVPLVLQSEYEDSLQGVLSIDDIMNVARDAGVEAARFEPICMTRRSESRSDGADEVFFVVFDAPAFYDFRQRLSPLFPEHGGNNVFDPGALYPTLTVAGTSREVARFGPSAVERRTDCGAPVRVDH